MLVMLCIGTITTGDICRSITRIGRRPRWRGMSLRIIQIVVRIPRHCVDEVWMHRDVAEDCGISVKGTKREVILVKLIDDVPYKAQGSPYWYPGFPFAHCGISLICLRRVNRTGSGGTATGRWRGRNRRCWMSLSLTSF